MSTNITQSARRLAANRANAQKSTGPRTPELWGGIHPARDFSPATAAPNQPTTAAATKLWGGIHPARGFSPATAAHPKLHRDRSETPKATSL